MNIICANGKGKRHQMSISPTFYARLFVTKVLRESFLNLHFRFELFFFAQEYWSKCAHKMLVKLTIGQVEMVIASWTDFIQCFSTGGT
jgi:hypothetical protein